MSWSWEVSFFLGKFCFLPTWDLTTRGCFYHQFPSISGIGGQELSCFPVLVPWGWDVSSFSDLDALGSVHLLPSLSYIVAILNMWSSALLFLSCKILPLTDTFFFFCLFSGFMGNNSLLFAMLNEVSANAETSYLVPLECLQWVHAGQQWNICH